MKAIARCALARRGIQWQIGRVGGRRVSAHYSCMPCFFRSSIQADSGRLDLMTGFHPTQPRDPDPAHPFG